LGLCYHQRSWDFSYFSRHSFIDLFSLKYLWEITINIESLCGTDILPYTFRCSMVLNKWFLHWPYPWHAYILFFIKLILNIIILWTSFVTSMNALDHIHLLHVKIYIHTFFYCDRQIKEPYNDIYVYVCFISYLFM
jgi:hypothetical protein